MSNLYEKLYYLLTDSESSKEANSSLEKNAPENFFRLLMARTCSKIGDRLSSPKTTLAWLLQSLGAPALFTGLIVPIRESGSLLPQLFLSNYLKRYAVRKWAWSLGALIQGAAIAGCAFVAVSMTGTAAGLAIVGLVVLFALARGISSVSAKDVLGKTVPKSKRGQLTGWAGAASGVIAIGSASFLLLYDAGEASNLQYALYLLAASVLWWLAAYINAQVTEAKSDEDAPSSLIEGFSDQLQLLKEDKSFRDFLIVRSLAVGSGLSTPYIVSLAHQQLGGGVAWLGVFIIAEGLAAMVASPAWGRWADKASRRVLQMAMLVVFVLLTSVIVYVVLFAEQSGAAKYVFPLVLFLLGVAHSGVRVGRKTYVVDMAEGNTRTDYVAVGNTLIGILLIIAGLITGVASLIAVEVALAIFALCALCGSIYASRLPRVSKQTDS
ncbi:MAG TPA: MFS transporter [Opitutae bacterium]|nr:MFS transporter [Opitutae bacterium]